jgi:transposase
MPLFRAELHGLPEQLRHLDERVSHYDRRMGQLAQDNAQARTLMTSPGVGPLGATALLAAVREDPQLFKHGCGLAAWLGLLPRQHSNGGKPQLLAITKRGDAYLRNLLIHGARAVLRIGQPCSPPAGAAPAVSALAEPVGTEDNRTEPITTRGTHHHELPRVNSAMMA